MKKQNKTKLKQSLVSTSNDKSKEVNTNNLDSESEEGTFSGWLKSGDGIELMKLFYSVSVWKMIDNYFTDQFIRYHNLTNNTDSAQPETVKKYEPQKIPVINIPVPVIDMSSYTCHKPDFYEIFDKVARSNRRCLVPVETTQVQLLYQYNEELTAACRGFTATS
ncbi:hypothetical protein CBL_07044 [Carabus blaptoides fortunei]